MAEVPGGPREYRPGACNRETGKGNHVETDPARREGFPERIAGSPEAGREIREARNATSVGQDATGRPD